MTAAAAAAASATNATVALAILAVLVPASVTLIGYWFKQQSDKRLDLQHEQDDRRAKVDLALRAMDLFSSSNDVPDTSPSSAKAAAGLLALARLDFVDLALALLIDLWDSSPSCVSTETAIQVIDTGLRTSVPDVQLFAAELLIRNAGTLDINNSLHWPSSLNDSWIIALPFTDKLRIIDALVHTALASTPNEAAIRTLAMRLCVISQRDLDRGVQAFAGTLMKAILPAVMNLGYADFVGGRNLLTISDMQEAAARAAYHPDDFITRSINNRSSELEEWSRKCPTLS